MALCKGGLDKFVIATRVPLNSTYVTKKWYVGTFKDLGIKDYTNAKARYYPDAHWPYVEVYKDLVFVLPSGRDHTMKKYKRQFNGNLSDAGGMCRSQTILILQATRRGTMGVLSRLI